MVKGDWKKERWASKAARLKDIRAEKPPYPENTQQLRDQYKDDPELFTHKIRKDLEDERAKVLEGIKSGAMIDARNPRDLNVFVKREDIQNIQKIIDQMARASGKIETPPSLIIFPSGSSQASEFLGGARIGVSLPEFIYVKGFMLTVFREKPEVLKTTIAHELAHIANRDTTVEGRLSRTVNPSQKSEVLADRMGAIIHGNPKKYADAETVFRIPGSGEEQPDGLKHHYISSNANARMLYKWADILEREGGTDKNGNITDDTRKRALEIFERSKEFMDYSFKDNQTKRSR